MPIQLRILAIRTLLSWQKRSTGHQNHSSAESTKGYGMSSSSVIRFVKNRLFIMLCFTPVSWASAQTEKCPEVPNHGEIQDTTPNLQNEINELSAKRAKAAQLLYNVQSNPYSSPASKAVLSERYNSQIRAIDADIMKYQAGIARNLKLSERDACLRRNPPPDMSVLPDLADTGLPGALNFNTCRTRPNDIDTSCIVRIREERIRRIGTVSVDELRKIPASERIPEEQSAIENADKPATEPIKIPQKQESTAEKRNQIAVKSKAKAEPGNERNGKQVNSAPALEVDFDTEYCTFECYLIAMREIMQEKNPQSFYRKGILCGNKCTSSAIAKGCALVESNYDICLESMNKTKINPRQTPRQTCNAMETAVILDCCVRKQYGSAFCKDINPLVLTEFLQQKKEVRVQLIEWAVNCKNNPNDPRCVDKTQN